jgi:hypothetical protein
MVKSFSEWLIKRENYGGMTGSPSFASPGPDGFGSSVPVTAMNTYISDEKPPTNYHKKRKLKHNRKRK